MIQNLSRAISPEYKYRVRHFAVSKFPRFALHACDALAGAFFPRYFDDQKVIFVHVPKSAGTSIAMALYGRTINHLPASYYRNANRRKFGSYYSFAVVRNPLERLVSAYLYAKRGGTAQVPISKPETYRVSEFHRFDTFFYDWLLFQKELDFVFRPQHEFLCDTDGRILVNDIFDITELHQCSLTLSEVLGKKVRFGHFNRSGLSNLDYRQYYTSHKLVCDVRRFYERDYECLGKDSIWTALG